MFGIVSPIGVIIVLLVYLSITIFSLVKMFGKEKKFMLLAWLFIIVTLPFAGSLIYLLYYYINRFKPVVN